MASSDNRGGRVLGLLCVERKAAGSNLAVDSNFLSLSNFFLNLALLQHENY